MAFKLSPKFLSEYEGKQPNWGFGELSYFTYKRTYARPMGSGRNEEYFDTCKRVTEGVFEIQRKHCKLNRLPWNAHMAQKTAQEFFTRMWEFKFSPPGRGYWIMGTEMVDRIGSAALQNCFDGSTEIITANGIRRLDEVVGTNQMLLTKGGKWVSAPIKEYGKQKLYEIVLSRQGVKKSIFATADHRWFASDRRKSYRDSKYSEFKTSELRPGVHRLQYSFGQGIKNVTPSPFGIAQGFTFGDGCSRGDNKNSGTVSLFGDKDSALVDFFRLCPYREIDNGVEYSAIPNAWKSLPSLSENKSFLYGWLAGYFAADGSCKSDGTVKISSVSLENIQFVRSLCSTLGIGTYSIQEENRISNLTGSSCTMYSICLMRQHLDERFFIIEKHRENFVNCTNEDTRMKHWTVESVSESDRIETVYCAEVADYNAFTLADNILTGNCGFKSTADVDIELANAFAWSMDMLMLGVGVGFDTEGAGKVTIRSPKKDPVLYVIPDSREGWVESIRLLINSYHKGGNVVKFDYSLIRKMGELIKGFGGTASGPEPLAQLHESLRAILDALDGEQLTSVAIVDMMNFIGKCVVAGNVRRSAELAIGRIDDREYIEMKDWRKFGVELNDRRWASNNSVFADKFSNFAHISPNIAVNGEPGIIFIDNARHHGRFKDGWIPFQDDRYDNVAGFNPCAEQQLEDKELCCLVETYPANHTDAADFMRTLKFAYLYAKTVTLVPTHDEGTNSVMMRNRRIGCSMSGIQQAIKRFGLANFLQNFCDKGYDTLREWDRIYSRWLGIPRSIRMSTIKPSGTVSILAGATPGVHFTHAEYYMRTVRTPANSPLVLPALMAGYKVEVAATDYKKVRDFNFASVKEVPELGTSIVTITSQEELSVCSAVGATLVIYFPVKEKDFTKSKFDVTMWEQLALVREMQYYWSDNSVSCTVTFKEEEKQHIESAIEFYAPYVKTLSFMPLEEHGYLQAPYTECTEQEYWDYKNSLLPLMLNEVSQMSVAGSKFCTNDTCEI